MTDRASTATSSAALMPRMLHHAAYVTQDAAATVDFYSRILQMDFVATVMDDRVPSTGEPFPYLHLFFRMADGSTFAFFECPSMGPPAPASHPGYDVFNHTALAVASKEEVDAWTARLRENGIEVLGPVDHGIIYSIYFYDPSGLRLEITTTVDESWDDHAAEAQQDLEAWEMAKEQAAATGTDLTTALLELIGERKEDMRKRGIRTADELTTP